jgi:hypothetical protein
MAGEVSFHQLFGAEIVTRVISRIKTPQTRIQDWMGMNPGGPASNTVGGDKFGWDIFDRTRTIAKGRPPGTGPSTIAPQKIGHQTASAYRAHEKLLLLESRIFRTRPPGGQWGSIDRRGQQYVLRQQQYLAQRFRNNREFMIAHMLRGGFAIKIDGDDWIPVALGDGTFDVNYRIPDANKEQLNMLGGGNIIDTSWATVATADIPKHVLDISSAFEQLHGRPLRHVWCNTGVLHKVLNNVKLQALAGTANVVFNTFTPSDLRGPDGIEDTGYEVVLRGIPWLRWHVYDAGLEVDGTFAKILANDHCIFLPDPAPDWTEWYEGSEVVGTNVIDPGTERFGLASWVTRVIDPAGFELKALDVGLPILYIPTAIAYGEVVFT